MAVLEFKTFVGFLLLFDKNFVFSDETQNQKMNVSIYIEGHCKFSRKFIDEQLKPVYDNIKSIVNFKYVPFGAAEVRIIIFEGKTNI